MANADGYTPYPINLTATQTVAAIMRAHNLEDSLVNYVQTHAGTSFPVSPNNNDLYNKDDVLYRASVDAGISLWIEV